MGAADNTAVEPRRVRAGAARQGQALSHLPPLPHRDEQRQAARRNRCRAGSTTASTTRSASRSRTRRSCPTCRTAISAGSGSSASSTTTARRATKAASRPGCGWARPCGLKREDITSLEHVLPGVRFAVDAYVNFARTRALAGGGVLVAHRALRAGDPPEAARRTGRSTIRGSSQDGYVYFRKRLSEARRDVEHGLRVTLDHFKTRAAAGARARHPAVQARRAVVACSTRCRSTYGIGPKAT